MGKPSRDPLPPPQDVGASGAEHSGLAARRPRKTNLPALAAACFFVAAALLAVRPWERWTGQGSIVDQVAVAGADGNPVPTGLEAGRLAPNFRLRTLDGSSVTLSALRGRPVVLNFWAGWCIYCVAEMPALQDLADRCGDSLVVAGINVGEARGRVAAFAERNGIRYLLLRDPDLEVSRAYTIFSMPSTYVIAADGTIAFVRYGVLTPPEIEDVVRPLAACAGSDPEVGARLLVPSDPSEPAATSG